MNHVRKTLSEIPALGTGHTEKVLLRIPVLVIHVSFESHHHILNHGGQTGSPILVVFFVLIFVAGVLVVFGVALVLASMEIFLQSSVYKLVWVDSFHHTRITYHSSILRLRQTVVLAMVLRRM